MAVLASALLDGDESFGSHIIFSTKGVFDVSKKKKKKKKHHEYYDYHHILFQRRHWNRGWAKVLREHPYCGLYIKKFTVHSVIHEYLGDIPAPSQDACKKAVQALNSWIEGGFIFYDDELPRRIKALISCFNKTAPDTVLALRRQLEIVENIKDDE